jgi:N-acetylmuramoyl-L-alanine amidase
MKPKAIVIHESASRWGDAKTIDQWHKARSFSGIGYHAVILSGRRDSSLKYNPKLDGKIEPGRSENVTGAHCSAKGMNSKSLGVCLIGMPGFDGYPTKKQMGALVHYLAVKCKQYGISPQQIYQHSDFDKSKPLCANFQLHELVAIRNDVWEVLRGKKQ